MGICSSVFETVYEIIRWVFPRKKRNFGPQYYIPSSNCSRRSIDPPTTYPTHSNNTAVVRPRTKGLGRPVKTDPLSFLEMMQLDSYQVPNRIIEIERDDNTALESREWINMWLSRKTEFRAYEGNYIEAYKTMLFFEEVVETIEMGAHNLPAVQLQPTTKTKEFFFNLPPNSEKVIAAINEKQLNRLSLKSKKSCVNPLQGKIIKNDSNKIFVEIFPYWDWCCGATYDIYFDVNQTNYQLQHNSLDFIKKHRLFSILINNPLYHLRSSGPPPNRSIAPFATNQMDLNREQRQAIECIVSGNYNPLPYLLYGPPGTGKTKTIVAAIETIVRNTTKNILVSAQSNAACNEITERLAKVLTDTEMLRMFSQTHDVNDISPAIMPFSNLFDKKLKYPSLNYLYKFRVLICTLSVSGCLVRAYGSDPKHFGFVFIDECASACETMTLIPIAGLCTSEDKIHANIVLIGDPKQLDAVVRSQWSREMGFKISYFERLFKTRMYRRQKETGEFDATYITQLTRNYRSHKAILTIPNELFYDNSLKASAVPDFVKLEVAGLFSQNFPIIFKSVHGYCKKPEDETSSYNIAEVETVMEFIDKLMQVEHHKISQFDVGVVSPYKLQCTIIRKRCWNKGYKKITIGSAEQFQGQERDIMIISTVQSGRRSLSDFVKNPQRFNVMLTRAKNLLIVVGNPHLLSQDENWSKFIDFCCQNRCMVQDKSYYFRPRNNNQWN